MRTWENEREKEKEKEKEREKEREREGGRERESDESPFSLSRLSAASRFYIPIYFIIPFVDILFASQSRSLVRGKKSLKGSVEIW